MEFNDSKTKENVARAFAGLCQDGARYQFIALNARDEGFYFISDTLKMFAKHKMAHASVLYQIMLDYTRKQKDNIVINAGFPFENQILKTSLKDSAEIEKYESENLYQHFSTIAKDEGFKEISEKFDYMANIYQTFAKKLEILGKDFDKNQLYERQQKVLWTCTNCGYTNESKSAWSKCPLCNYPQGYISVNFENNKNK